MLTIYNLHTIKPVKCPETNYNIYCAEYVMVAIIVNKLRAIQTISHMKFLFMSINE
jgi:hypothetical protein